MSHYINLLEENECLRVTTLEVGPLYKIGAAVLILAVAFGVFGYFTSLQADIRKGEALAARWKEIEKTSQEAEARNRMFTVLQKDVETLKGWSSSRHARHSFLEFLAAQVPEPTSNIQFTRLYFDETMLGLRQSNPDRDERVHPLRREITMDLQGRILSDRPEIMLDQYRQRLMTSQEGLPTLQSVQLRGDMQRISSDTDAAKVTEFNFILLFQPRELKP